MSAVRGSVDDDVVTPGGDAGLGAPISAISRSGAYSSSASVST